MTNQQLLSLTRGHIEPQVIAKKVGVSRITLYKRLKNPEFNAEIDRRIQKFKDFGEVLMIFKLHETVQPYW